VPTSRGRSLRYMYLQRSDKYPVLPGSAIYSAAEYIVVPPQRHDGSRPTGNLNPMGTRESLISPISKLSACLKQPRIHH